MLICITHQLFSAVYLPIVGNSYVSRIIFLIKVFIDTEVMPTLKIKSTSECKDCSLGASCLMAMAFLLRLSCAQNLFQGVSWPRWALFSILSTCLPHLSLNSISKRWMVMSMCQAHLHLQWSNIMTEMAHIWCLMWASSQLMHVAIWYVSRLGLFVRYQLLWISLNTTFIWMNDTPL